MKYILLRKVIIKRQNTKIYAKGYDIILCIIGMNEPLRAKFDQFKLYDDANMFMYPLLYFIDVKNENILFLLICF